MKFNLCLLIAIFMLVEIVTVVHAAIDSQNCQEAILSAAQKIMAENSSTTQDPMQSPPCNRINTLGKVLESFSH